MLFTGIYFFMISHFLSSYYYFFNSCICDSFQIVESYVRFIITARTLQQMDFVVLYAFSFTLPDRFCRQLSR